MAREDEKNEVLEPMLARRGRWFAADLEEVTGFHAGKLYVMLAALEADGKVTSGWTEGPASRRPTPRRRFYEATDHLMTARDCQCPPHNDDCIHPTCPRTAPAPSITCPRCQMTSYNPNDIREGYCGHCHDWTHLK